jgi:triosephosphate isomerase
MNLTVQQASLLVERLNDNIQIHRDIVVVLTPSMLTLQPVSLEIDRRKFRLAAQNAYFVDEGAYTGEVSFTMLNGIVHYCLIGHSERRIYFNETLEVIRDKVQAAVRNEIAPILCVGETKQERANGETKRVIQDQVTTALSNLTVEEIENVVIAYEPIWAIKGFGGTQPAKPDEIKSAIDWIRRVVGDVYGEQLAHDMRVIYGASVEPDFVQDILGLEGVDGLLPGSASLNYQQFAGIVEGAYKAKHKERDNG